MEKNRVITGTVSSLKDRLTRIESEKEEVSELRSAHVSQNQLLLKLQEKVSFRLVDLVFSHCCFANIL